MFKTLESFQKQLYGAVAKVDKAQDGVDKAVINFKDAEVNLIAKADGIRAEADALIVRANQINKMVDAVVKNADL